MPSRCHTKPALTATSTAMMMVDQPIGLRTRPGRGSDSASSAGAGLFGEGSDNGSVGSRVMPILLKGGVHAMQTIRSQADPRTAQD
ncbi:hypothetical protein [Bradyrhizobium japonicum]|uniref:hypothetical protein n=1 Tax=Bradyrhizobium japonicum TaxID=375 RepID=UPI0020A23190|nr:hypothetical protein [Bradyrhizobium japonicum]MCP1762630.1 hypothetical protein [Bradyrhizobium japonicum]MCP1794208.1 hypothetical protein [Bradyrhizobium japonicum]MCP1806644.1 hypothetical protein [Bradyrhizobium japonicum]MCP1815569.1 hypothetical protein [Bradyrhizobium japonicum]MCP1872914.1 hypothetical protein [Bradyrhizobium japonicum]